MDGIKEKVKDQVKDLCKDLALNHIKNSLPKQEHSEAIEKILESDLKGQHISTRNIVILGSGASYDAFNSLLPLGPKSVELLEQKLKFGHITDPRSSCGDWEFANQLNEKYKKLYEKINLNPLIKDRSFETRLTLMSHFFDSNTIRNEISLLFDYKTFPSYFYEIIAHLLKNRFIEGIINFNFDELLDQSINEEIGDGRLSTIISDGDCIPYSELLTSEKLREPFYIKPHGTASHKSSLRFTKEQYLNIPPEIENLMEEIFVGQTIYKDTYGKAVNENHQFNRLNLIIFGFAMESVEFNSVLRKSYNRIEVSDKEICIYFFSYVDTENIVDKNAEKDRLNKIFKDSNNAKLNKCIIKIIYFNKFSNDNETIKLNPIIELLLNSTVSLFKDEYKPEYPIRHKLLCDLFKPGLIETKSSSSLFKNYPTKSSLKYQEIKDSLYYNTSEYFLNRVIFESILVVIKNRGLIQPKESLKGINRIGHYYHLYYNSFTNTEDAKSIHSILYNLGLSPESKAYSNDIYSLVNCKSIFRKATKSNPSETINFEKWINQVRNLNQHEQTKKGQKEPSSLNRFCDDTRSASQQILQDIHKALRDNNLIEKLLNRDSLALYPNYKDFQLNYFGHIDPINIVPTTTALKYRFNESFLRGEWNVLLLTSDRGYDLLTSLRRVGETFKNKEVILILADLNINVSFEIRKICKEKSIKIKIFYLPFYDHSNHLKLFFESSRPSHEFKPTKNYTPKNAIYYYKKGFSNNINAIHLNPDFNHRNILLLFDKFLAYYLKAIKYSPNRNKTENSIPHITSTEQMLKNLNSTRTYQIKKTLLSIRESLINNIPT